MEPVNNLPLGNGELFQGNLCSTNAVEEVPAELFDERLGVKVPGKRHHSSCGWLRMNCMASRRRSIMWSLSPS